MFTPEQEAALAAPLDGARIKQRQGPNNRSLSYLETWDVIATANAVFGFAGWSRETVMLEQLHPPVLVSDEASPERGMVVCAYWAKTRVTVHAGNRTIVREGCGAARGFAKTAGEAMENALKGAESDSLKRALMSFGSQFGLALYDREQRHVTRSNGRRQLGEQAIDTGFAQRRQVASQRAIAARDRKLADDIPV
jgi:recombination DNA repair RAD52 pathway protein